MMSKDQFAMRCFLHPAKDLHLMEIALNNNGIYMMFPDDLYSLLRSLLMILGQAIDEIETVVCSLKIYLISGNGLYAIALFSSRAVTIVVCSVPPRSQTALIRV